MKEVKEYCRYITDRRLLQLGLKPNFKVKDNPLTWLEWVLNGADHTNFFENRVTEYEVAGFNGKWDDVYDVRLNKPMSKKRFYAICVMQSLKLNTIWMNTGIQ